MSIDPVDEEKLVAARDEINSFITQKTLVDPNPIQILKEIVLGYGVKLRTAQFMLHSHPEWIKRFGKDGRY